MYATRSWFVLNFNWLSILKSKFQPVWNLKELEWLIAFWELTLAVLGNCISNSQKVTFVSLSIYDLTIWNKFFEFCICWLWDGVDQGCPDFLDEGHKKCPLKFGKHSTFNAALRAKCLLKQSKSCRSFNPKYISDKL